MTSFSESPAGIKLRKIIDTELKKGLRIHLMNHLDIKVLQNYADFLPSGDYDLDDVRGLIHEILGIENHGA